MWETLAHTNPIINPQDNENMEGEGDPLVT
jgi:hypothetical protein